MYIEQSYSQTNFKFIKYLPIPIAIFSLSILNYISLIVLSDINVELLIQQQIEIKGINCFLIESLVPFCFGLLFLFLWVKYIHKQTITSLTTSRKKIDWKRIIFSFVLWSSSIIGITVVSYYLNPEFYEIHFRIKPFIILVIIGVLLIPLQASFEEYLFRGYLLQGIGIALKNKWAPLLMTSFLFGIMHIGNPEVSKMGYIILFYYIGTGLFLGIITLMDEGLELAIGFHVANNLVTALLITSNWTVFQTDSILKSYEMPSTIIDIIVPLFIVYPILLFIFSNKYKWKNWKEKLSGKIDNTIFNKI